MQHSHFDGGLLSGGHHGPGQRGGQQKGRHKHCSAFHISTPFCKSVYGEKWLHLELEADSGLPEIGFQSVESCVLIEAHHAGIELLDDVVEIDFTGFLVVVRRCAVSELRLGILAEDLELAYADRFRKEVASKDV